MNILIVGASGFIGTELVNSLHTTHQITVLGRDQRKLYAKFANNITKITWEQLEKTDPQKFDVIINLCGSNIGEKRWTPKIKHELISSRVNSNYKILSWLKNTSAKPRILCANAVGIYGLQDETDTSFYNENTKLDMQNPKDFMQEIGVKWQGSLNDAKEMGISTVTMRFGVVLKKGEGMLKKLELPFKLGMGSTLGNGQQVLSWVYYQDLINAILFILSHKEITGPINITSPKPVTQREFAQTFAKTLQRPLFLKTPAFVLKLMFGEMALCLLLKGQRVLPTKLESLGFKFTKPYLKDALYEEYRDKT